MAIIIQESGDEGPSRKFNNSDKITFSFSPNSFCLEFTIVSISSITMIGGVSQHTELYLLNFPFNIAPAVNTITSLFNSDAIACTSELFPVPGSPYSNIPNLYGIPLSL